jgi:hypothetical protein
MLEAILEEKQGPEVTMARLLEPFPAAWVEQLDHLSQRPNPDLRLGEYRSPQLSQTGHLGIMQHFERPGGHITGDSPTSPRGRE